ncbi:hypothetical protein [Trichloromonas sp.]|uniref:hypothetical protein n=1 Tax=Trichloromonas sp. TaxID=3069249 RepID=UPI002A3B7E76|nr:hypothetical protein [Trichloromonas sp.]
MKLIKTHQDYLEYLIIESINNDEFLFIISSELYNLLKTINHPIAEELVTQYLGIYDNLKKQTFLDIVYDEHDKFYFVNSNKLISVINKDYPESWKKYNPNRYIIDLVRENPSIINKIRTKIRIGRLIKKLFGDKFPESGKPGEDIQSFMDEYARQFEVKGDFRVVEGEDIIKYYNVNKYSQSTKSNPLRGSCMRYEECGDYLKFYAINPDKVKLIILMDEDHDDKIKGRALLWKIDEINEEKVDDVYFMDRIYFIDNETLNNFVAYAIQNGYLYKMNQTSQNDEKIVNPKLQISDKLILKVKDINYDKNLLFPYLDTLYMYNPYEKILTNDDQKYGAKQNYVTLDALEGKTKIIWSDRYNDILLKKINSYYSEYLKEYIKKEDSETVVINGVYDNITKEDLKKLKFSKEYQTYYDEKNVIYLEEYDDYIPLNKLDLYFVYSDFFNRYYRDTDAIYSKYMNDYIPIEHAIRVYTDKNRNNYYITLIDDPNENFYKYNGEYYSNDVKKEDLK